MNWRFGAAKGIDDAMIATLCPPSTIGHDARGTRRVIRSIPHVEVQDRPMVPVGDRSPPLDDAIA